MGFVHVGVMGLVMSLYAEHSDDVWRILLSIKTNFNQKFGINIA